VRIPSPETSQDIYIDRKRRQKREELQNTEYLIRRREGGREGLFASFVIRRGRERPWLQE
jgi:hypothetical protein